MVLHLTTHEVELIQESVKFYKEWQEGFISPQTEFIRELERLEGSIQFNLDMIDLPMKS